MAIYGEDKYGEQFYGGEPIVELISVAQREGRSFNVDVRYRAKWLDRETPAEPYGEETYGSFVYGPPKNFNLVSVEYSTDGGGAWNPATIQPYDRQHTSGEIGGNGIENVWKEFTEFGIVWSPMADLEDGEYSAMLRFSISGSITVTLITGPFTVLLTWPVVTPPGSAAFERRAIARGVDDFLGRGPVQPLRRGSADFMQASGKELIKWCVWQILSTRAATDLWGGELAWDPAFGSLFWTLKHAPGDEITEELAHGYAEIALEQEPRVRVAKVETEFFEKDGGRGLRVRVRYAIITKNVPGNEVFLPQFLETAEVEIT
jgi:hypothetical protein